MIPETSNRNRLEKDTLKHESQFFLNLITSPPGWEEPLNTIYMSLQTMALGGKQRSTFILRLMKDFLLKSCFSNVY